MRLSEQRRKAAKRDEAIRNYVENHPIYLSYDEIGLKFHCSRETARKALKSVRQEATNERQEQQV